MNKDKFNEIIDFAVKGEKGAVKFYQELQQKTKFAAQKKMLKDFENMEKGHIVILENIRQRGMEKIKIQEVTDLQISNYIVEMEPSIDMDYQDILILAMKKEETAQKLYEDMAAKYPGSEIGTLFKKLAVEEASHKLQFETMYDEHVLKEN